MDGNRKVEGFGIMGKCDDGGGRKSVKKGLLERYEEVVKLIIISK